MSYEDTREVESMRKIFVGGISRDTTDDSFANHFGQYGTIVDKVLMKDRESGQPRGFGFITYDNSDSVEDVFKSKPHELDGRTLDCKRAMPKECDDSARAKTTRLFVGGISQDMTTAELQSYIDGRHSKGGCCKEIVIVKDKETNKNKGFGFIECDSTDFADRLVLSEASFSINGKQMAIKKAEQKGGADGGGGRGGFRGRGGDRGGRGGRGGGDRGGRGGRGGGYSAGGQSGGYGGQSGGYGGQSGGYGGQSGGYGGQSGGYGGQSGGYAAPAAGGYGGGYGGAAQSGGYGGRY